MAQQGGEGIIPFTTWTVNVKPTRLPKNRGKVETNKRKKSIAKNSITCPARPAARPFSVRG